MSESGTSSACPMLRYSSMTALNEGKVPFEWRERSKLVNLLTACVLDSPRGYESVLLGRGTINLPDSECVWWVLKCLTTVVSSGDKTGFLCGFSSSFQNLCNRSSPVMRVVWWEATIWRYVWCAPCQDPSKLCLKCYGRSLGARPPAMELYSCKHFHSKENVHPARRCKIWVSQGNVWQVIPTEIKGYWL